MTSHRGVGGLTGQRVSVCIPARNEEGSIAPLLHLLTAERDRGVIHEIVVLDHGSTDETARVARAAGARVVDANAVARTWGPAQGKGDVLWRSLLVSDGEIVVWLDADLTSFPADGVRRLIRPLLDDDSVVLVKGAFSRSLHGQAGEGGRVTELAARPVLSLLAPELAHLRQPLSGQCAIRRRAAEDVVFEVDYGVEVGLLLDLAYEHGPEAIHEVDLGPLDHRHQSLSALSRQAEQVLRAVLSRRGHRELEARTVGRPPVSSLRMAVVA
ncbi:MAG: putative glucosyl-3-phosphoglycerate synthase [Actinomycetota bacterium]|jgi:glucosyl-3-phosphoglycerate synthase